MRGVAEVEAKVVALMPATNDIVDDKVRFPKIVRVARASAPLKPVKFRLRTFPVNASV